jgi:hypothetical protein
MIEIDAQTGELKDDQTMTYDEYITRHKPRS